MRQPNPTALALALALALAGCSAEALPLGEAFNVSPESVTFEPTLVGTTARERVTIDNRTDEVVTFTITRGPASSGTLTASVDTLDIAAESSGGFEVVFAPTFAEPKQARFELTTDGFEPIRLLAEGVGIGEAACTIEVASNPLDFGEVVTRSRAYRSLTLTNPCEESLNVELVGGTNVEVCPPGAPTSTTFCFDAPATVRVPAEDQRSIDVRFVPFETSGRVRATAVLRTCPEPDCEVELQLVGTAVETGLVCEPDALDFGRVDVGNCAPWTVRCTNRGNTEVLIDAWGPEAIGTPTSPDFVFEDYRLLVVEPGDTFTARVEYCPSDFGRDTGHFGVRYRESTAQEKLIYLPLSGFAGQGSLSATPNPLDFGTVSTIAPVQRTLRVDNSGTIALEIASISTAGADADAFEIENGGATILDPGEHLDLRVLFSPSRARDHAGLVRIETTDPEFGTLDAPLTGVGVSLPPCQFVVATTELDFGRTDIAREQLLGAQIDNRGSADCLLTRAQLTPQTSEAFELIDPPTQPIRFGPGASVVLRVRYRPEATGTSQGALHVELSNPSSPTGTIDLLADAGAPVLVVSPRRIDLGNVGPSCAAPDRTIRIDNLGLDSVQVTRVEVVPAGPFTVSPPGLPTTITPGDSRSFLVGYADGAAGSYAATLQIDALVGASIVRHAVPLFARSSANMVEETLRPLAAPRADVLFVALNRPGTANERALLGDLFGTLTAFADTNNVDYQLGVTTVNAQEQGRLVHPGANGLYSGPVSNKIITRNTQPSPGAIFDLALELSSEFGAFDSGLSSVYQGLASPIIVGHNAGFLRPEASLSVVFLSDADDVSAGPADAYARYLLATKEDPGRVQVTSIVAGETFCTGPSGSAGPAPRYVEVAQAAGGTFTTICSTDWAQTVADIGPALFGYRTRFALKGAPQEGTIEVTIEGVVTPAVSAGGGVNWTYTASTNTLTFSPLIAPTPGDDVRVRYATVCL